MKRENFLLNCNELAITGAPRPVEAILLLPGYDREENPLLIRKRAPLVTGQEILPGVYSTVTGRVKCQDSVILAGKTYAALRVDVADEEKLDPGISSAPGYLSLPPSEILHKLNRAGLGFCEAISPVKTVLVSAVESDPLDSVYSQILIKNSDAIHDGLKLLKHLTNADRIILAVPQKLLKAGEIAAANRAKVVPVSPYYPNGLPEILMRDIPGAQEGGLFIGVEKLIAAVSALAEGRPFTHKVVTIISKNSAENKRVRLGTTLTELLKDYPACEDDKIIIGGPFRGFACVSTDIPVTERMNSIYIQGAGDVFHPRNDQCISCGKCVKACPVNLDINLISRYAEFSLFEKCVPLYIDCCFECGLCACYCPAERSLLEFVRFAKVELKKRKMEEES